MSLDPRVRHILLSFFLIVFLLLIAPGAAPAGAAPPVAKALSAPITAEQRFPTTVLPARPAVNTEHKPAVLTDTTGAFRFEGLDRGTHQVYLDSSTLPAHLRPAADGLPVALWLNPGESLVSEPMGAGVRFSATYDPGGTTISGVVFFDQDGDGRQGAGERGLAGVTVIDPNVHQYFVPFNDKDLIVLLAASNVCQSSPFPVGNFLASRISITASSDNTEFYYDHWEDGYDPDPLNPGPTTVVGMLAAGKTRIFEDDIDTIDPNWGTTLYYDGRDRITVFGEPVSVVRAAFPSLTDSPIGPRLAGAWEIDEVANWGTEYVVPAGEDRGPGSDFEFTYASVTALRDGTQVSLNGAAVGTPIDTGQTQFVPPGDPNVVAGLNSGDRITADGPIEVHLYGSICDSPDVWSGNGYTLEPLEHWTNDYWSPVPRRTASATCPNAADMDIFLYNDNTTNVNLTIDDGAVYNVALPTGSWSVSDLIAPALLSDFRGVHIQGDAAFWGVVNFDAGNTAHEWGYSLLPVEELSSQVVLGWAPGNDHKPPMAQYPPSGNLAFVTPVNDTTIFADFDRDGTPDPIDCNGDGDANDLGVDGICDEPASAGGVAVTQGLTLRVADPGDADLTGALIYTQDLTQRFAVAWGQDSCVAAPALPYLDMGYTVLPIPIPSVLKFDALAQDVDESGDISPSDILTYTVVIANNGQGPMRNVVMTDVLPYTYVDFIVGSIASVSSPPPLPAPGEDYFDGTAWGYTPTPSGAFGIDPNVQQLRLDWPVIQALQTVTVTFLVQIQPDVPPNQTTISNLVLISTDETGTTTQGTTTTVGQPIMWLDKLPSDPTTVQPGGLLTYTVVVSNVGTASALNALAVDDLPPWLTYVSNTLDLTWPTARVITSVTPISHTTGIFTATFGDNFDLPEHLPGTTGFTGSDGTLPWIDDWTEIDDDGLANLGDIRVLNNAPGSYSPTSYLQLTKRSNNGLAASIERCANLSGFTAPHLSYRMRGVPQNAGADDTYSVVTTSPTRTSTYSEQYALNAYETRDLDLSLFAGESPVCIAFMANPGMEGLPAPIDEYRIDDVFIYDASPERYDTFYLTTQTTVIEYSTRTNIDPVAYTRILPDPNTAAITHTMTFTNASSFPAQTRATASFQMQVGSPLTDGLQLVNTACVAASNVITEPYPLCDTVPTTVRSNHVLTITKSDEPDPVMPGQLLTYGLLWEVGGDEPAPGVVVTDNLPLPYVSFVSCAPLPACQGETSTGSGVVTWDLGDRLPPMSGVIYDSGRLTVTVRVDQRPPGGVFTNTVIIDDETDTPPDEDDEPTTVPEAS
jgi:uncharacterized repeat protein (TIGR01451 family)